MSSPRRRRNGRRGSKVLMQLSRPIFDRLPPVRGKLDRNAPLASAMWFRVGGPAEVLFRPTDRDDLISFVANCPDDIPLTVLGVGSNILIRDGGIRGVVIRLGREFAWINVEGNTVAAGGSAMDVNIARAARDASLAGLEFLSGIPGTIGGALRMNAGAYEREIKDVMIEAEALDRSGRLHHPTCANMGFTYRHSAVPDDWIFLGARLAAEPADATEIARRMRDIDSARKDTQPVASRTGGSTFKNPPGTKAWQVIDDAGCRGLTVGGAMVSEQHCNFLINTGSATAADVENLGEEIRRRVREHSGVELEWEIKRIGEPASGGNAGQSDG